MALSDSLAAVEEARGCTINFEIESRERGEVERVDVSKTRVDRVGAGELGAGCVLGGFGEGVVFRVELEADC